MTDEPVELPDEYGYWTRPATGPSWSTFEVGQLFYGFDSDGYDRLLMWLRDERSWIDFDGRPIEWETFPNGNKRWRLHDIERGAHVLATAGKLSTPALARAIGIVKLVAQQHGVAIEFEPLRVPVRDRRALRRQRRFAARPQARFFDDFDGQPARPRRLALGENEYEIDLSDANWAQVIHGLSTVLARARLLVDDADPYHPTRAERVRIRAWAQQQGLHVSTRGVIARSVLEAYRAAMKET